MNDKDQTTLTDLEHGFWWCAAHNQEAKYYKDGIRYCILTNQFDCQVGRREIKPKPTQQPSKPPTSTLMRDFMSDLNALVVRYSSQKESVAHLLMLKAEALELEIQREALDEELRKVLERATSGSPKP